MGAGRPLSPKQLVRSALGEFDYRVGSARLSVAGDPRGLLSVLFHAVTEEDDGAAIDRVVDPTQTVSTGELDSFVQYFRKAGYTFVTPEDVLQGLPASGRFILITFDDGYWNNLRALPVLEAHGVPALFFISTHYIESGNSYWWDVIHRERRNRSIPQSQIWREQGELKKETHNRIDEYLVREFGAASLRPVGDDDRPMTPEELTDFARHPLVHIGNHTHNHGILTNYEVGGILEQLELAQERLETWTGIRPRTVSYPNGNYSSEVIEASRTAGFELGLTLRPERNSPALREPLALARYCLTRAEMEERTYTGVRSGISLRRAVGRLMG